jgi:hypothetical protein
MKPQDRTKLLGGPYRTPRCRVGRTLRCTRRGRVIVRGITDGPIPWPYSWRSNIDRRPSLILCGDLVRAVRMESGKAIMHWWQVGDFCVWKIRSLSVLRATQVGVRFSEQLNVSALKFLLQLRGHA